MCHKVLLSLLALCLISCTNSHNPNKTHDHFVSVKEGQFVINDKHYSFVGTNIWYGAYLGSPLSDIGNRQRLINELDLLQSKGISNLRILGASEDSPLKNSMSPAIHKKGVVQREDILIGLDFLLAEMSKRNMKAVIYLNNFWEWSGGMATYLSWVNDGKFVDLNDPEKPWPAFALFSAEFYSNKAANEYYRNVIKTLLTRVNSVTGTAYANDSTIMSWQLANEPRPGHISASTPNLPHYYAWIKSTAKLIKSLAPKQLVSIGSEGWIGCIQSEQCVIDSYTNTHIDYMTFHMWLKNWGWLDINKASQTYPLARSKAKHYIDQHKALAQQLRLPLVLEEFGLDRDAGELSTSSKVSYRDNYFKFIFNEVERSVSAGGPLVGTNFWAWGGYGKAQHDDFKWRTGDTSFVGDPPQEPQGLNSVFSSDESTLDIIEQHAKNLSAQ